MRTLKGPLTLESPGQVLENVTVEGRVTVRADNVILRNVVIHADDYWVLMNYGQNTSVEDSTLIGTATSQASLGDIDDGSFSGRRLNIYGAADGVKMGGQSSLSESFIHDLASFDGAHNDGIEVNGAGRVAVVGNTILNDNGQTSAITVSADGSRAAGVIVQGNLLAGGGYTVYGGSPAQGITFVDNAFSTRYFAKGGYWGSVAYWSPAGNIWKGNYWLDGSSAGTLVLG